LLCRVGALYLGRANPANLRGAVSVHGMLTPPPVDLRRPISTSVLVLKGWEDPVASPADVLDLADEHTRAGASWQFHAYGHAKHAFTAPGLNIPERGLAYDEAAATRSWSFVSSFLEQCIGKSLDPQS
jgi:dienelactone hydrolase